MQERLLAGYESKFAPGTEGVEDGSGTTVDGSVETTKKCVVRVDIVLSHYNIDSGQTLIRVVPSCSAK